jgi:predicted membrane protein
VDLDFGGTWSGDMDGTVKVALGSVTVHVPRDVGLRLDVQRFAASFDADSLVKRDGAYYSDNWDSARYHLRLNIKTTFGGITLDRFGSTGN